MSTGSGTVILAHDFNAVVVKIRASETCLDGRSVLSVENADNGDRLLRFYADNFSS